MWISNTRLQDENYIFFDTSWAVTADLKSAAYFTLAFWTPSQKRVSAFVLAEIVF